jgi:hypothetical protein
MVALNTAERCAMQQSRLEALVHAAVDRQITVAELRTAVQSLPEQQREAVYSSIRREQRQRVPRPALVPGHRTLLSD